MRLTAIVLAVYIFSYVIGYADPIATQVENAIGVLVLVVFILEVVGKDIGISVRRRGLVPLLGFLVIAGLGPITTGVAYRRFVTVLGMGVLYFITLQVVEKQRGVGAVELGLYSAVIYTVIQNIDVIMATISGTSYDALEGFAGTMGNRNKFALAMTFTFGFAIRRLYIVIGSDRNYSVSKAAGIGVLLVATMYLVVMLSGSRKGIGAIILLAIFSVALFHTERLNRSRASQILVLLVLAGLGIGILANSEYLDRFDALLRLLSGQEVHEWSLRRRIALGERAVIEWVKRPIFGWGLDQFRYISGTGTYTHSNYLSMLVNTGIVGTMSYYGLHASVLMSTVGQRPRVDGEDIRWAALMVFILLAWDIAGVTYYENICYMVLASAMGIMRGVDV